MKQIATFRSARPASTMIPSRGVSFVAIIEGNHAGTCQRDGNRSTPGGV